jgi:hypothetical protein
MMLKLMVSGASAPVSMIWNERTRLLANALDRASTACLTVGVLAPAASALTSSAILSVPLPKVVAGASIWMLTAVTLHLSARKVLRRLK